MRSLEREIETLRNQGRYLKDQAESFEARCKSLETVNRDLQRRLDELDRQNTSLISGDQKLQHLNAIKSQSNTQAKQLMTTQQELVVKKMECERLD